MPRKIGATLSLDGERQFRQAISEVNRDLRTNATQLEILSIKYRDNGNSVKALTERDIELQKQLENQREKVNRLGAALGNAQKEYGENDAKTVKWQQSLEKARVQLAKMEMELKDNGDALKIATVEAERFGLAEDEVLEKSTGLAGIIEGMAESIGVRLPAGFDSAIRKFDSFNASTIVLLGATVGLISNFGKITVAASEAADEILTLSSTTGLATDTIQGLKYASDFLDVSFETVSGSMKKLLKSMQDARSGSGETAEAFRRLRIRVQENGQLKDVENVFYDVVDALGKMRNESERNALSMQIFGKSAQELNPLIAAGSDAIKEYYEEAKEMGYIMDKEQLEKLGRLDDAMRRFDRQADSFKNSLAVVMLPVLTAFFETLNLIDPKIVATVAIIGTMAVVALTVVKAIKEVTGIFGTFSAASLKTTAIVVGVVAALIALAAIIAVITGKSDDLNKTMDNVGTNVGRITGTVNNAGSGIRRNATGTSYFEGGLSWVGENGPELVALPRGSQIYNHQHSMDMMKTSGQTTEASVYNITIDAKSVQEFNDIVRIAKSARQRRRSGVAEVY